MVEVKSAYGARPVSVDIARSRTLTEPLPQSPAETIPAGPPRRLSDQAVADRLALAHWPRGHQILVCSLVGGSGRTTIAGLVATVLAELPYAHIWHPYALVDADGRAAGQTSRRWDVVDDESGHASATRAGAWAFARQLTRQQRLDFSAAVVDCPSGVPGELPDVRGDANASLVVIARPDRTSLADTADALVSMNDQGLVSRDRMHVLVNRGAGIQDRGSRAAAAVLGIRCAAIHSLSFDPVLGPARVLPSGKTLPLRVRRPISRLCLDLWTHANTTTPNPQSQEHP